MTVGAAHYSRNLPASDVRGCRAPDTSAPAQRVAPAPNRRRQRHRVAGRLPAAALSASDGATGTDFRVREGVWAGGRGPTPAVVTPRGY